MTRLVWAALACLLAACVTNDRQTKTLYEWETHKSLGDDLNGVSVRVTEVVEGQEARFNIPPKRKFGIWEADMKSTLVVSFEAPDVSGDPQLPQSATEGQEWEVVQRGLRLWQSIGQKLATRYQSLNRDASKSLAGDQLQQEIGKYDADLSKFENSFVALLGKERYEDIQDGKFAGADASHKNPWLHLADWLNRELVRLVAESPKQKLSVRAYHWTVGKKRVRIHVENWDDLDTGVLQEDQQDALKGFARQQANQAGKSKEALRESGDAVTTARAAPSAADTAPLTTANMVAGLQEVLRPIGQIDNLMQGKIDISKVAGLREGDRIEVQVLVLDDAKTDATDPTKVKGRVNERSFEVKVIKAGWRIEGTPALVFVRAEHNSSRKADRTKWKPQAAAIATVNYKFRSPRNWRQRIVNFLDPGIGIHLTAPDMEDDAVEFGIGTSLTFRRGLVNLGYGWNLMSDDTREYFFIGVDLFELFNKGKELKAKYIE